MSVGNYFEERSENINRILNAASPEKKHPHPPLYGISLILYLISILCIT